MFSSKTSREGKIISIVSTQTNKWEPRPIDLISMYAKEMHENGHDIHTSTVDMSMSCSDLDESVKLIQDVELDLVNADRRNQRVSNLVRSKELDALARVHVRRMANARRVMHSRPGQVVTQLACGNRQIGENVGRGKTFDQGYWKMMKDPSSFCNVVDHLFTEIGMATAKGSDGKIYICQLFQG